MVLGDVYYTPQVHSAWVRIYSRMLRTIVPVAVSMELKDGSAQTQRLSLHTDEMYVNSGSELQHNPTTSSKESDVAKLGEALRGTEVVA